MELVLLIRCDGTACTDHGPVGRNGKKYSVPWASVCSLNLGAGFGGGRRALQQSTAAAATASPPLLLPAGIQCEWSAPARTDIPSEARFYTGSLPDGRIFLVGNQAGWGRNPLMLSLSEDGVVFDRSFVVRYEAKMPPVRFPGRGKSTGFDYPGAVIVNGTMVVAYSVNKEDIELAAFPLTDLATKPLAPPAMPLKNDDPHSMAGGSDSPSLEWVESQMALHSPHLGLADERVPLLRATDEWAARNDTVYWNCNSSESNPEYLAFYLRRVQKALKEVRTTAVPQGRMRVWKLYSSGSLVKTAAGVFSIDVVEGPKRDLFHSPGDPWMRDEGSCRDPQRRGVGPTHAMMMNGTYTFQWTPAMRIEFAQLVDVYFSTHRHGDHTDYGLVDHMMRANKTVVTSRDMKALWLQCANRSNPHPTLRCTAHRGDENMTRNMQLPLIDWADRVKTLPADTDVRIGGFEVRRLGGPSAQQPDLREAGAHLQNGTWVCNNSLIQPDPLMNVYLIRPVGAKTTAFLHNGDNRCACMIPALKLAIHEGWRVTLFARTLSWPEGVELVGAIDDAMTDAGHAAPVAYPGHNYEIGHKGGHPRVPWGITALANQYLSYKSHGEVTDRRFFVMTWGESLVV